MDTSLRKSALTDPDVRCGKPTLLSNNVECMLRDHVRGCTAEDLLKEFPDLERQDIPADL